MAQPLSPTDGFVNSQEFRGVLDSNIDGFDDLFEDDPAAVTLSTRAPIMPRRSQEFAQCLFDESNQQTQDTLDTLATAASQALPGSRRDRFKYAKRSIFADYRLFLYPESETDFRVNVGSTDWKTYRIRGKIVGCPSRRKHGNFYKIEWNGRDIAGLENDWLRRQIPNTEDEKHLLRLACLEYDTRYGTSQRLPTQLRTANNDGEQLRATTPTATQRNVQRTPPTAIRAQAAADLMTTAHTFGTGDLSSLTRDTAIRSDNETASARPRTRLYRESGDVYEDSTSQSEGEEPPDITMMRRDTTLVEEGSWNDEDAREYDDEADKEAPEEATTLYEKLLKLQWKFTAEEELLNESTIKKSRKAMYDGPEGVRHSMANSFNDPLECFFVSSGLTTEYVANLAQNTNAYFETFIAVRLDTNKRFHGAVWKPVTISEMYRFFGILLRISTSQTDLGGYHAYFCARDITVDPGGGSQPVAIDGTAGTMSKYMSLSRFRQIRGAFHPEAKRAGGGGDKCYQLRSLINAFNQASMDLWETPRNIAFDEGGVGCRSRYCPVRQYNKDKPEKYRVDFFVLSSSRSYAILYLDVYQGRNGGNVGVHQSLIDFPTTQKVVLNALHYRRLHLECHGQRHLAADNRYACPELAVMCREKYNCYLSGTCRVNRKGWDKEIMTLSKSVERGACRIAFDEQNEIVIGQWNDNKVVNFVSSMNEVGVGEVQRRVGSQVKAFPCPIALILYQKNMYAVDKGDQMRSHGAGFSNSAHFKKWYKRCFLAILDCGLLNALIAWNLTAKTRSLRRKTLKRFEFYSYIAQRLCNYKDPADARTSPDSVLAAPDARPTEESNLHRPEAAPIGKKCRVCCLEHGWDEEGSLGIGIRGIKTHVSHCTTCGVCAHIHPITAENAQGRKIFGLEPFKGLSCYEIIHTKQGREIWQRQRGRYSCKTNPFHDLLTELRSLHRLPPVAKKQKRVAEDD